MDRVLGRCIAAVMLLPILMTAAQAADPNKVLRVTFQATEIGLGPANLRTFPTTLPHVRFQAHHLLDLGLTKNIRFGNRVRVQVRVEALNAENYTLFGLGNLTTTSNNATFGRLSNSSIARSERSDKRSAVVLKNPSSTAAQI